MVLDGSDLDDAAGKALVRVRFSGFSSHASAEKSGLQRTRAHGGFLCTATVKSSAPNKIDPNRP